MKKFPFSRLPAELRQIIILKAVTANQSPSHACRLTDYPRTLLPVAYLDDIAALRQVNSEFCKTVKRVSKKHLFVKKWSHLAAILEDSEYLHYDSLVEVHLTFTRSPVSPEAVMGPLLVAFLERASLRINRLNTFTLCIPWDFAFPYELRDSLESILWDSCIDYIIELGGEVYSTLLDSDEVLIEELDTDDVVILGDRDGAAVYSDGYLRGWLAQSQYARMSGMTRLHITCPDGCDFFHSLINPILVAVSPTIECLTLPMLDQSYEALESCCKLTDLTLLLGRPRDPGTCHWGCLPPALMHLHLIATEISSLQLVELATENTRSAPKTWTKLSLTLPEAWYEDTPNDLDYLESRLPVYYDDNQHSEEEQDSNLSCSMDWIRLRVNRMSEDEYESRQGLHPPDDIVDLKEQVLFDLAYDVNCRGIRISVKRSGCSDELVNNDARQIQSARDRLANKHNKHNTQSV